MGVDMTLTIARIPHHDDGSPLLVTTPAAARALDQANHQRLATYTHTRFTAAADELGLEDEDGNPDPAQVVAHLVQFINWFTPKALPGRDHAIQYPDTPRDTTLVWLDHNDVRVATGGLSGGDAPTDPYDVIRTADHLGFYDDPIHLP